MKKLFVVALVFALTLTFSNVASAAWVDTGYNDELIKAMYIDDDVTDEDYYCTMWVKTILRTPQKLENGKNAFVLVALKAFPLQRISGNVKEINTKKDGVIALTAYDANNNVVSSFDRTGHAINWSSIIPDTMGALEAEFAKVAYNVKFNR